MLKQRMKRAPFYAAWRLSFITQHNKLYESPELAKFVLSRSTCFFDTAHRRRFRCEIALNIMSYWMKLQNKCLYWLHGNNIVWAFATVYTVFVYFTVYSVQYFLLV